jgi:hypothetical protein
MEDMQKLWEHGVNVWDEYKKEHFNLKNIIFYTINDNPTRLALIGQVKGRTRCVICVDQTESIYLLSSSKLVYMWHHRYLPPKNRYRQWRSCFDGTIENGEALKHRDNKFVFEIIKNINVIFGKPMKGIKRKKSEKPPKDSPFKKKTIFFRYLPYWKEPEIGHTVDAMHVEKGVFKSTIGLLLGIPSKTNDELSAHKDLQALEIREELHPQERSNEKAYLPPPSYTLTTEKKWAVCKCVHGIRVLTRFSTNIKIWSPCQN